MSVHKGRQKKDSKSANFLTVKEKHKLWFQNLMILNFHPASMKEKHKLQFYNGMFERPNKAGFEILCYYLFTKVDNSRSTELFRGCYPVLDKKQCQQFRTVCLNWWKRLSEEHPRFSFSRVTNTLLMSPTGAEVDKVLFSFSTFALFMEARGLDQSINGKGHESSFLPPLSKPVIEGLSQAQAIALQNAAHSESIKFMRTMQISKQCDMKAKKQSDLMLEEYRSYVKLKKELEQRKKELLHKLRIPTDRLTGKGTPSKNRSTTQTLEKTLLSRTNSSMTNVRKLWKNLLDAVKITEEEREIVNSVLTIDNNTKGLNAASLSPKVPATLLQQCTNKVYKSVGTSLYEGGQLNLCGLMKLFNLSLHLLIEKLHEVGVPNFESQLPYIKAQIHICEKNIKSLHQIRKTLKQSVPETQERIKTLTLKVDEMYRQQEASHQQLLLPGLPKPQFQSSEIGEENRTNEDLGILTLTPPFQFSDDLVPTPSVTVGNADISKDELFEIAIPGDLPNMVVKDLPLIEQTSTLMNMETTDVSNDSTSTLKQGSLEIGLSTSPKTSRKGDKPAETLLRKRLMKHNIGKSSGLPRPAHRNLTVGNKPSSLPSTPVAKPNDITIERVTSRTPEAVKNLVNQVVDYTMLEMSVQPGYKPSDTSPAATGLTPALLDISSQLDTTVFDTHNKIARTPPEQFMFNATQPLVPEPASHEPHVDVASPVELRSRSPIDKTSSDSSTKSEGFSEEVSPTNDCHTISITQPSILKTPHQPHGQRLQYATPGMDIAYSNYPSILDMKTPKWSTSDSFLDSLNMPETPQSSIPDVPTGNLIDL